VDFIMAVKSFVIQALVFFMDDAAAKKLECLSLAWFSVNSKK
jgi:hypothetical protein